MSEMMSELKTMAAKAFLLRVKYFRFLMNTSVNYLQKLAPLFSANWLKSVLMLEYLSSLIFIYLLISGCIILMYWFTIVPRSKCGLQSYGCCAILIT